MTSRTVLTIMSLTAGLLATASPASAQWFDDESDYQSYRRGRYTMRSDPGYANPGYRRYRRNYEDYADDERQYRRRAWRNRWNDEDDPDASYQRKKRWADEEDADEPKPRSGRAAEAGNDEVRSGGPRPDIGAKSPPRIPLRTSFAAGTVVIDQGARALYYILSDRSAYRYPISVGREGFSWTGTEKVSRIADWPDWHPPEEMRDRDPSLPAKMTGGINNPLGAKAIYLGNTLYRIHGTNNPKSIGQAASSGCFRMMNAHVLHLASMVNVGTPVHVMKHLPKNVASFGG